MDVDLDIIKEIGNIGVGSASTALGSMIDKSINISIPAVYVKNIKDFVATLSKNNKDICLTIYSNIEGDLSGGILNIYTRSFLEKLLGKSLEEITRIDKYKIMRYNDIITYSYINSIGRFLNIEIISTDSQIIDVLNINKILMKIVMDDISKYEEVIINETKIFLEKDESICYIALLLSKENLNKLFKIIKEKYGF